MSMGRCGKGDTRREKGNDRRRTGGFTVSDNSEDDHFALFFEVSRRFQVIAVLTDSLVSTGGCACCLGYELWGEQSEWQRLRMGMTSLTSDDSGTRLTRSGRLNFGNRPEVPEVSWARLGL